MKGHTTIKVLSTLIIGVVTLSLAQTSSTISPVSPAASLSAKRTVQTPTLGIGDVVAVDIASSTIKMLRAADGTTIWTSSVTNDGALAVDPLDLGVYTGIGSHSFGGNGTVYKLNGANGNMTWINSIFVNQGCNFYVVTGAAVDGTSASPGVIWTQTGCYGGIAKTSRDTGAQQWSDFTLDIPQASIDPSNGQIYDITDAGPQYNYDTIYSVTADGNSISSASSCEGYTDLNPADGMLYRGGSTEGHSNGCGVVLYQMNKDTLMPNWMLDLSNDISSFDALGVQPWSRGYIYVASATDRKIVVVDPATRMIVTTFTTAIPPRNIAVNPIGGNLYITDGSSRFVYAYSPTGSLVRMSPDLGGAAGSIATPRTAGAPTPAPPAAHPATYVASNSFTANWNSVNFATGYRLDVATNSSFTTYVTGYENLNVGNATNRSVTGLNPSTHYYYRVRAYNAAGTSGNSNTISVTTLTAPPAAHPATYVASNSFTANWSSVNFATGYRLDVATNSSFTTYVTGYENLNVGNATNRSVTGLNPSTHYYYRVRAYNAAGTSGNSNTISVTTLTATGAPMVTTNPATVTSSSATLNGSLDPHGLTTTVYFQYGTTTSYGHTTRMQSQTGNTYRNIAANISGLTTDTTYHFRIVATNSAGTKYGIDRTFTTL